MSLGGNAVIRGRGPVLLVQIDWRFLNTVGPVHVRIKVQWFGTESLYQSCGPDSPRSVKKFTTVNEFVCTEICDFYDVEWIKTLYQTWRMHVDKSIRYKGSYT